MSSPDRVIAGELAATPPMDGAREDRIARDFASGLPAATIIADYGLKSQYELQQLLDKPRVQRVAAGFKAEFDEVADNFVRRRRAASLLSLRQLGDYIAGADIDDHKAIDVRRWFVDLESRPAAANEEPQQQVPVQLYIDLRDSIRGLLAQPVVDILPEDKHLHSGKDFMERRDKQLAALGGPADGSGDG